MLLKTSDWFNVKLFPKATFKSREFKKLGENNYQASGDLSIRDKTVSLTIQFDLQDYHPDKFIAKGKTSIKRTAFGIGQGDWADTNEIKDDVKVDFNLQLKRAN